MRPVVGLLAALGVGFAPQRFIGEIVDSRAELNDAGSPLNTALVNTVEPPRMHASWTRRDVFTTGDESRVRLSSRRVCSAARARSSSRRVRPHRTAACAYRVDVGP
jgi:hypothetical protein